MGKFPKVFAGRPVAVNQPEDDRTLRKGTVDFVSFSYYFSRCITVGLRVTLSTIYYRYKKVIASDGGDLA